MTQTEIRALLQEAYDREQWKQLVTALFPGRDVFARPVEHEATTVQGRRQVQRMLQFGDVQLADGNLVGLFEVEVAPGVDLTRNRVAIRKAMEQPVKQSGHSGALIAFVDQQQGLWRFSFYSNTLKDDGTWDANTPKRYTYLLGKGEQCLTAARQFDALVQKAGRSTLADLLEAFSVEKVGKAFFREYKEHYQDLVQHLTGKRMVKRAGKWEEKVMHQPSPKLATYFNGSEKDARDFCKKLMGRLVFLYFLQKKRWLGATTTAYTDGDTDFVYRLFRATGGEGFYPTVLTTLFFETLNKERANDDYRMPDGSTRKVPFLNGGLFDMDALDRKTQLLTFPPELFSKPASADDEKDRGFLDFLNAYNFTVHEAGPEEQTLAVDPEMLGHIFENLLEDNKDKGAFYTPKEIVHYMCQESLTQYLKNYLLRQVAGTPPADLEDHLRTFLKDGTGAPLSAYSGLLLKALHEVKVCDPAIGSGAFPMGILHEIFQAVYHLQEFSPDEFSSIWGLEQWEPAEVKLRIIQHSIYGVDIERGAVDIARLRFWLSIIVDEPRPRTLPNLDYKIVVGDSLLGKFKRHEDATPEVLEIDWSLRATTERTKEICDLIDSLHEKTDRFFRDQTQVKKAKLEKEIRALKIELLIKQLELDRDKFREKNPLPGGFTELSKAQQAEVLRIKNRLSEFESTLGQLRELLRKTDKPLVYFDWQLDFPEVLNPNVAKDPGFDIVIANPPYMRVQQVQKAMPEFKKALEAKYTNAKGSWDLANVFFERAVQLVKGSGNCCYIFPHKFFNSDAADVFRSYLLNGTYVDKILHFGANQVFNEADTYTCIAQFSKTRNEGFHFAKVPFEEAFDEYLLTTKHYVFIPYERLNYASALYGSNEWIFFSSQSGYEVFGKIYATDRRIGTEFARVFQGIATGKDELYLFEGVENGKFVEGSFVKDDVVRKIERGILKPFVKGRSVHRYSPVEPECFILFPYQLSGTGEATLMRPDHIRKHFPNAYAWLLECEIEHRKKDGRSTDDDEFYRYARKQGIDHVEVLKLSSMEICSAFPNVAFDHAGLYHPTTVYSWVKRPEVVESYEFFMAIGNSRLMWWFLMNTGDTLQGDARRMKSTYLNPFPLPKRVGRKLDEFFATRVKHIIEEKRQGAITTALEREIDVLVCKLYGLSWEQAKVVDPELGVSKEAYEAMELPEAEGPTGQVAKEPGTMELMDEGTLFGQPVEEVRSDDQMIRRSEDGNASKAKAGGKSPSASASYGQAPAAILAYLKANTGWHGKGAILHATGVDTGAWNSAIKELLEAGKVERQGEKKGAKYMIGRGK